MVSLDSLFLLAKQGFTRFINEPIISFLQTYVSFKSYIFHFRPPPSHQNTPFTQNTFSDSLVFHLYDKRKVLTSFLECTIYFFQANLFTLKPHISLSLPPPQKAPLHS